MADTKISALTELAVADLVDGDWIPVVDTSTATTKKYNLNKKIPFTPASASGAASLQFLEDTDNGTNKITLSGQASLAADIAQTLPAVAGTLLSTGSWAGGSVEDVGAVEMNVSTIAATGATETLDLATYNVFDLTMDQSCAFTLSNPAASGDFSAAILIIRGAFTPSFTNTVIEPDNTALTYSTPSVWGVFTVNGGTSYFLVSLGKSFA